jgi:hypothetical protein
MGSIRVSLAVTSLCFAVSGCKKKEPPPAPAPAQASAEGVPGREMAKENLSPEVQAMLLKLNAPGLKPGEVPDVSALTKDIPGAAEAVQKIGALLGQGPADVEAWLQLLSESTGDPAEVMQRGRRFTMSKANGYMASGKSPDCGPFQVLKTPAVVNAVIVKSMLDMAPRFVGFKRRLLAIVAKFPALEKELRTQYRLVVMAPATAYAKCIPR